MRGIRGAADGAGATGLPPAPATESHARAGARSNRCAQICTDIGRVGDPERSERTALAAQPKCSMPAASCCGSARRPAPSCGRRWPTATAAEMVARIPVVLRSANNAAAAAYRSGTLQIVLSRAGFARERAPSSRRSLSADGCVGVLSAEIRDGGESSETVQSLATIFAAQLAGVVASTPSAPEQRAAGSGAV